MVNHFLKHNHYYEKEKQQRGTGKDRGLLRRKRGMIGASCYIAAILHNSLPARHSAKKQNKNSPQ